MSGAIDRARAVADRHAARLRERVRARLARALPGVRLDVEGDRIRLSGRNLIRRWIAVQPLSDRQELDP